MKANIIVFEISAFIFALATYIGASRALGKSTNRTFFLGIAGLSLAIETAAVLLGYRNYYWYAQNNYFEHYPLGGIIIWLGVVPLAACLIYYIVTAMSYFISKAILPQGKTWVRAAVAGLLAVAFDLVIEVLGVANHWWTWNLKSYYLFDVPVLAWLFIFCVVFVFTGVFDRTMIEKGDLRPLQFLEERVVRQRLVRSNKKTKNLNFGQLRRLFYLRLTACTPALAAVGGVLTLLLWLVANRGHIPPGW